MKRGCLFVGLFVLFSHVPIYPRTSPPVDFRWPQTLWQSPTQPLSKARINRIAICPLELHPVGDLGVSLRHSSWFQVMKGVGVSAAGFCIFKYLYGTLSLPSEEHSMSTPIRDSKYLAHVCTDQTQTHTHTQKDWFFHNVAELRFLQLPGAAV